MGVVRDALTRLDESVVPSSWAGQESWAQAATACPGARGEDAAALRVKRCRSRAKNADRPRTFGRAAPGGRVWPFRHNPHILWKTLLESCGSRPRRFDSLGFPLAARFLGMADSLGFLRHLGMPLGTIGGRAAL